MRPRDRLTPSPGAELAEWSAGLVRLWTELAEDLRTSELRSVDKLVLVEGVATELCEALIHWCEGSWDVG